MGLHPLPASLAHPFTVASARALDVPRSRLRASDLRTPFHGVRTAGAMPPDDYEASVLRRATEFVPRMRRTEFFALVTAAVVWGGPLPASAFFVPDREGGLRQRPLDVGVILPDRASRVRGVRGRSIKPGWGSSRIEPVSGWSVTSPATTWAMMGAILSVDDLIALGDAFVREPMRSDDPPALASIDDLTSALAAGRRIGASALREALPLIRTRSRSRRETQTRLLLRDALMPEPELNWPVVVGGAIVALLDLAYPMLKLAFEYEGEQHLTDAVQWGKDIRRYELLADAGWRVIRATKTDLDTHRDAFIARSRAAYARAKTQRS